NAASKSPAEPLITCSTSDVAAFCSSASFSSRLSFATSVSLRAGDELRRRTALGALSLLRAAAFGACALGDLPPALDRRRIAAPWLGTRHRGEVTLAHGAMGRHKADGR